jgi:hypothetical protein
MEPFAWQLSEETAASSLRHHDCGAAFPSAATASVFLDGNQPAHVRSTDAEGEVLGQNGPFKLSGAWWDQQAWARAEWDVQLAGGAVCRCHEDTGAVAGRWHL